MPELRVKLNGFQAKPSEHDRITEVAKFTGKSRSEFLRDTTMKEGMKKTQNLNR